MTASELKKSILQMAVEGKLTEQSEKDEPIEELLKRIKEEKENLIKEGRIKREKTTSEIYKKDGSYYERIAEGKNILKEVCIDDELPFDIPDSWAWVKINSISKSITAGGDKPNNYSEFKTEKFNIPILSNGKENDGVFGYTDIPKIIEPSITISSRGTIGFSCVRRYPYFPIVRLISIIPFNIINLDFVKIVFDVLIEKGVGTSVKQLTVPMLIDKLIPLPPIEEQKRIAEKINQLMPLINEYDSLEKNITKLNKEFPNSIKKSILQYAIEGKLTEQSEKDEPVEKLLKRIKEEKDNLIKEGKIKKDKTTSEIYKKDGSYYERITDGKNILKDICIDDELPFEIPDSWAWVRLNTLSINYDNMRKPVSVEIRSKQKKVYDYYGATGSIDKVDNYIFDGIFILIGEDGGNFYSDKDVAFIVKGKFWANNHVHVLGIYKGCEYYFCNFLNSLNLPAMGLINGIAVPKLNQSNLNKILIPLPPIEEQKRIVDKINRVNEVINNIKI